MRRVFCALACIAGLAAAAAGCGKDEASPSAGEGGGKAFVSKVDATCQKTQDASRAGPRFPYRTFDPTNPDRRQRAVGRFYVKLDTEGTLAALADRLRAMSPPAAMRGAHDRLLADLDGLAAAVGTQTKAALSGNRSRMIAASGDVEHAFEVLGDSAADFNAFACALSLERWPKTIR
jgi:hypothetical protein